MTDNAYGRFRRLARTLLSHHQGEHSVHQDANLANAVYQTSTMSALLDGVYDGDVTIGDLLTHGDFGLGTFNHLDGEMVILDGICHQLRADGTARVADADQKTPFAAVTWFQADTSLQPHAKMSKKDVLNAVDRAISSPNLIQSVRITGTFVEVDTRTVMAQTAPYPPLAEATANQATTHFAHVAGTLAGFRTPNYEQGISVAGYHLHFLADDRRHGGHVEDFLTENATIEISSSSELHLSLPRSDAFLDANLTPSNIAEQIRQAEGG